MSMNEHGEWPDGSFIHRGPLPPIHVPVNEVADHPLLRHARIPDDSTAELEWPGLTNQQKRSLEGIRVIDVAHQRVVSIPPRVNLDFLVDEDTDAAAPPFWTGRAPDLQRFYTRFTDTQFLHVGTYTAITVDGIRRYFMWGSGIWSEIGLGMFVHHRDSDDTHFGETGRDDLDQLKPGAWLTPVRPIDVDPRDEDGDADGDEGGEDHDAGDDNDEHELMTEVDAIAQHGRASAIASLAHRGQVDKLGYDYIDHPARVADAFDWLDEPVAHCAAWLHDVVEDSDITAKDLLAAGMLPEIVEVVELLTRRDDVADEEYYRRIRQRPIALAVKLADLADNEAGWRFRKLDYETQARLSQKYFTARQHLKQDPS